MTKKDTNKVVAAIDIGTTKVCALIAKLDEFGKLQVIGLGRAESDGVKDGSILNIDKTVDAIKQAMKVACDKAGADIEIVNVGFAGKSVQTFTNSLSTAILSSDGIVTKSDLRKLNNDVYKVVTGGPNEIIHVIPQLYKVDGKHSTIDPVGYHGSKLECDFHVITVNSVDLKKIKKCVEGAGLVIDETILEPLASSKAVLSDEEKEHGVAIVDIGGGTTDIAIFLDGIIKHTCVIPFGGNIISSDIQEGLAVTISQAETLKVKFGSCLANEVQENMYVSIPGIRDRAPKEISMRNLSAIIDARMEEIADWVALEIERSNLGKKLKAGLVITGGGSMLKNVDKLFEIRTGMDVRVGYPNEFLGKGCDEEVKKPMYATGIGLLLAGFYPLDARLDFEDREEEEESSATVGNSSERTPVTNKGQDLLSKFISTTKSLFFDDFKEGDKN
jgi:cell division protein FtsA